MRAGAAPGGAPPGGCAPADAPARDPPAEAAGRVEYFYSEQPDPVFERMVQALWSFDEHLEEIREHLEGFLEKVDAFAEGVRALSECAASFSSARDRHAASEGVKLQQGNAQIMHPDAPHSVISKFRKNLEFNVSVPIQEHLEFNAKLRKELEARQRRLQELRDAKRQLDLCMQARLVETDANFKMAKAEFETSKRCFRKVDRHVFEWLYILEEYRDDILDSFLQTLKYLQYEFFAQAAHAIGHTLPARLEFRPMSDMLPACLEAEVDAILQDRRRRAPARVRRGAAAEPEGKPAVASLAAERLLRAQAAGDAEVEASSVVDPLSLCSLLAQGFEEGPARRALRLSQNDTQAALDWLLRDGEAAGSEDVRRPETSRRGQGQRGSEPAEDSGGVEPRAADIGAR